ncbi:hypothetical protein BDD12DRAFT_852234 [Trichophaea hybrida]|nr:hypothetical protein BDD12DRAFT_852234 [Trichophaea hybrida]
MPFITWRRWGTRLVLTPYSKEFMLQLEHKGVIPEETLPCKYFDMIGGTSTGG